MAKVVKWPHVSTGAGADVWSGNYHTTKRNYTIFKFVPCLNLILSDMVLGADVFFWTAVLAKHLDWLGLDYSGSRSNSRCKFSPKSMDKSVVSCITRWRIHSEVLATIIQIRKCRYKMQRRTAIPRIETTDDLEAAVVSLETDIRTALERSTTETREVRQANYIGEIPLEAQQLIRDRRAARRRALRSGAPEYRRIANQLSRRVRAALDEHRQETWRRFVESLNPRDNSLWKTQKALKTRRRPVPPLHGEQGIVHTNRDKAEAFADSLELQCRENQLDDEDEEHTALARRRTMRRYVPRPRRKSRGYSNT
ncbi:hypothetical protein NQ315_007395 [Exocentrus adspersus]|uniref:Uncharacterized protein n=1 Tax=Exocentrus adspersus TaxID=1586481 RepID=A0AAV8VHK3_9CUCU|nr:hypothetical protein NQ315_007395 [Exocentrus adspersus]